MRRLHDLSSVLSSRLAPWPGDIPVEWQPRASLEAGDPVALSALQASLHAGTHVDAPSHVQTGGPSVDRLPLEIFLGPCQVIRVHRPPRVRIFPEDLPDAIRAPRVLFRTDSHPDPERFTETFNGLAPELIERLAAQGVVLVGLDTPSVDPYDDATLACHQALARFGMVGLEGLVLHDVAPGLYTLCALPLKIEGAEASPVRAVLVEIDQ